VERGFDLTSVGRVNREADYILKEGYIVVNFEILRTIRDDTGEGDIRDYIRLDYKSPNANQWQIEGYNTNQQGYPLEEGDIILYYTDKKASDDFRVR
ncbi:hypothetical protein EDC19_2774, partial [Natranaerovirga hydrolytica]